MGTAPSIWPAEDHQLLLKAAFLPPEAALAAWRNWRSTHDIDSVDHASFWLMPLVYQRLMALSEDDRQLGILKGLYKRTWFRNQILHHHYFDTVGALERAGVDVIVIKGVAALRFYGGDCGVRPMWDCDFMVRVDQVATALDVLLREGWTAKPACTPEHFKSTLIGRHHGWNFLRGDADVDMHWHLLPQDFSRFFDGQVWAHRQRAVVLGREVWVPSVTEHLIQTCVHAARYNVQPSANWAADAFLILRDAAAQVDWERLVAVTVERRLVLPMRDALGCLGRTFELPILTPVMERLGAVAVSDVERLEHEANMMHPLARGELHHRALRHMRRVRLSESPDVAQADLPHGGGAAATAAAQGGITGGPAPRKTGSQGSGRRGVVRCVTGWRAR